MYEKALHVLKNYQPKALACQTYFDGENKCAIGALIPAIIDRESRYYNDFIDDEISAIVDKDWLIYNYLQELNLTVQEATIIQNLNDNFFGEDRTPEDRYHHVVSGIENLINNQLLLTQENNTP